jgi:hypothetical protein
MKTTKIRKAARGQDCSLRLPGVCCFENDTVILAHLNTREKGISRKSNDIHGVFACWKCHDVIDGRNRNHGFSKADLLQAQFDALVETQLKLVELCLLNINN